MPPRLRWPKKVPGNLMRNFFRSREGQDTVEPNLCSLRQDKKVSRGVKHWRAATLVISSWVLSSAVAAFLVPSNDAPMMIFSGSSFRIPSALGNSIRTKEMVLVRGTVHRSYSSIHRGSRRQSQTPSPNPEVPEKNSLEVISGRCWG